MIYCWVGALVKWEWWPFWVLPVIGVTAVCGVFSVEIFKGSRDARVLSSVIAIGFAMYWFFAKVELGLDYAEVLLIAFAALIGLLAAFSPSAKRYCENVQRK